MDQADGLGAGEAEPHGGSGHLLGGHEHLSVQHTCHIRR
jgi:hypothetical protein